MNWMHLFITLWNYCFSMYNLYFVHNIHLFYVWECRGLLWYNTGFIVLAVLNDSVIVKVVLDLLEIGASRVHFQSSTISWRCCWFSWILKKCTHNVIMIKFYNYDTVPGLFTMFCFIIAFLLIRKWWRRCWGRFSRHNIRMVSEKRGRWGKEERCMGKGR